VEDDIKAVEVKSCAAIRVCNREVDVQIVERREEPRDADQASGDEGQSDQYLSESHDIAEEHRVRDDDFRDERAMEAYGIGGDIRQPTGKLLAPQESARQFRPTDRQKVVAHHDSQEREVIARVDFGQGYLPQAGWTASRRWIIKPSLAEENTMWLTNLLFFVIVIQLFSFRRVWSSETELASRLLVAVEREVRGVSSAVLSLK